MGSAGAAALTAFLPLLFLGAGCANAASTPALHGAPHLSPPHPPQPAAPKSPPLPSLCRVAVPKPCRGRRRTSPWSSSGGSGSSAGLVALAGKGMGSV